MSLNPSGFGTSTGTGGSAGPAGASGATGAVGANSGLSPSINTSSWHTLGRPFYPLGKINSMDHSATVAKPFSVSTGDLQYVPFRLGRTAVLSDIMVRVTTAAASGITLVVGVYNDSATSDGPGSLLSQLGAFACNSLATIAQSGLSVTLNAGVRYWLATQSNATAAAQPIFRGLPLGSTEPLPWTRILETPSVLKSTGTFSGTSGSLPDPATFDSAGLFASAAGNAVPMCVYAAFSA